MLSETFKILLDYESERNVTKRYLKKSMLLLFWEVKL